jgi:hypothetical protein
VFVLVAAAQVIEVALEGVEIEICEGTVVSDKSAKGADPGAESVKGFACVPLLDLNRDEVPVTQFV